MEDGESNIEYRDPFGVTIDDEIDSVRVLVVINNLKKAFAKNEPAGGEVYFKVEESSFDLKVSLPSKDSGVKKMQHFRYEVHKLPKPIIPSRCDYKVKDGKIIIRLFKAKKESWEAILSQSGLETLDEESSEGTS